MEKSEKGCHMQNMENRKEKRNVKMEVGHIKEIYKQKRQPSHVHITSKTVIYI